MPFFSALSNIRAQLSALVEGLRVQGLQSADQASSIAELQATVAELVPRLHSLGDRVETLETELATTRADLSEERQAHHRTRLRINDLDSRIVQPARRVRPVSFWTWVATTGLGPVEGCFRWVSCRTLFTLPPELVALIVSDLDRKDKCSLARSCFAAFHHLNVELYSTATLHKGNLRAFLKAKGRLTSSTSERMVASLWVTPNLVPLGQGVNRRPDEQVPISHNSLVIWTVFRALEQSLGHWAPILWLLDPETFQIDLAHGPDDVVAGYLSTFDLTRAARQWIGLQPEGDSPRSFKIIESISSAVQRSHLPSDFVVPTAGKALVHAILHASRAHVMGVDIHPVGLVVRWNQRGAGRSLDMLDMLERQGNEERSMFYVRRGRRRVVNV